jgi:AcrR family transcriptional regulator
VFGEKGYTGATTKEIAVQAKVNEVTIFRIFNNKAGLFDAVVAERFPRTQLLKELHFERGHAMDKVLVEISMRYLTIMRSNRDMFRILTLDLPRLHPGGESHVLSNSFVGPLSGYLASQAENGFIKDVEPEAAAEVLYGILHSRLMGGLLYSDRTPDLASDLRFVKTTVAIYLNGIGKPRTGEKDKPIKGKAK